MLCRPCQQAGIQSLAPGSIPPRGRGWSAARPPAHLLGLLPPPRCGTGHEVCVGLCLAPVQSRVRPRQASRAGKCSYGAHFTAASVPRTGRSWHQISQRRRKGSLAEMNACGLLPSHQISRAALSLSLMSWGSRRWFGMPFPETSFFHNMMFPSQPAPRRELGPAGAVCPELSMAGWVPCSGSRPCWGRKGNLRDLGCLVKQNLGIAASRHPCL